MSTISPGTIYLVGAGPGDPSLITLRGIECLARADLVLYDYLVNRVILAHARPGVQAVALGHHATAEKWPQGEINRAMIDAARGGKNVVRLKGGDPAVFGRLADEVTAIAAAGVPFEIVPGVTAGLAAASYAGIPITHADRSSAVALVTGHERREKNAPPLDYEALADFPGTLIFYMGVTTSAKWTEALLRRGKPGDTPVAIVRRATWPDQETVKTTLAELPRLVAERGIRPPAVVVVGDVAAADPLPPWFENRPLFGRRVLVTRPRHQACELMRLLGDRGADVLLEPAIEIAPPEDWQAVDRTIQRLGEFHWIVFSSANGVTHFLDRLMENADLRRLASVQIAAIGPGTAEELARYRLRADRMPEEFRAEALAAALTEEAAGRRFLLVRASRGREVLAEQLRAAGGAVEQVVVYRSRDVERASAEVAAALDEGRIDWITVTSSAIAQSLARMFGENLRRARLASISPVTSATLRQLGFEPAAEATVYTMEGVVEAILASSR